MWQLFKTIILLGNHYIALFKIVTINLHRYIRHLLPLFRRVEVFRLDIIDRSRIVL